jgi:hypothetical protein
VFDIAAAIHFLNTYPVLHLPDFDGPALADLNGGNLHTTA